MEINYRKKYLKYKYKYLILKGGTDYKLEKEFKNCKILHDDVINTWYDNYENELAILTIKPNNEDKTIDGKEIEKESLIEKLNEHDVYDCINIDFNIKNGNKYVYNSLDDIKEITKNDHKDKITRINFIKEQYRIIKENKCVPNLDDELCWYLVSTYTSFYEYVNDINKFKKICLKIYSNVVKDNNMKSYLSDPDITMMINNNDFKIIYNNITINIYLKTNTKLLKKIEIGNGQYSINIIYNGVNHYQSLVHDEVGKYTLNDGNKYKIKENGSDGNCFLLSLHQQLEYRNTINNTSFNLYKDKNEFSGKMREYMADSYINDEEFDILNNVLIFPIIDNV